jgi:hypothetical protein
MVIMEIMSSRVLTAERAPTTPMLIDNRVNVTQREAIGRGTKMTEMKSMTKMAHKMLAIIFRLVMACWSTSKKFEIERVYFYCKIYL